MKKVFMVTKERNTVEVPSIHCLDEVAELQDLLENNFELLAGDQIDPVKPRRWLLIKREMPIVDLNTGNSRWSIDFLFADQSGIPTFVECKRYKDTRSRREVVGQMMEYAANAQYYWNAENLLWYASETAKNSNKILDDVLSELDPEDPCTMDNYFERVHDYLEIGQIRLIFFLEESPPELRSIVDFLNKQMESTEVLIVEARQYSNESMRIIVPTLFGFSEQARQIKRRVTVRSGVTAQPRQTRIWTRPEINYLISGLSSQVEIRYFDEILRLADDNKDLIFVSFGSGSNASIILKNNRDSAIVYTYLNGIIQTPAPYLFRGKIESLLRIEKKYSESLIWKTPMQAGKMSSLNLKLGQLNDDQFAKLKEFILELATELHDVSKDDWT